MKLWRDRSKLGDPGHIIYFFFFFLSQQRWNSHLLKCLEIKCQGGKKFRL